MTLSQSSLESLRRVFHHNFSVHDITEPLVSREQSADAGEVRAFMEERHFDAIGVRRDGLVIGYLERASLGEGPCSEYVRSFDESHVILDTTPLAQVILGLRDTPRLFVSVFGRVGGIVTRSDLQKGPVRMWLFGMVTIIEMRVTRMIEKRPPGEDWRQYVSAARLKKAEQLLAERARRNQDLDLIDCLQFSDKCQIVARSETLRSRTRYDSRRQIEAATKRMERLRNNLAHAQDIIATDWESLVELAENLDDLLEGPPASDEGRG